MSGTPNMNLKTSSTTINKIKKSKENYIMKKYILLIAILSFTILLPSCYEGYTSKEGKPLEKYLSPEKLKELTLNPDSSIWIIDVRPNDSYKEGHIPTAKSYSSSIIMDKLNELPKEKYLILYCETGGRAQSVIKKLEKQNYTKMMNWGGYTRWPYKLVEE